MQLDTLPKVDGRRASSRIIALLLVVTAGICAHDARAQADGPQTVVVKMLDKSTGQWRFVPEEIKVRAGDTVRFVQEDIVPHNVEFRSPPKGSRIDSIRLGPFLMSKGQTYDIIIDDRFVEGTYEYVCTPHAPLGMTGSIKVIDARNLSTN